MATEYRVYTNDGMGGPVDYGTPIATTAGLSFAPAALAPGEDRTFDVRAFDAVSGYEESNADARVRIALDGSGVDATAKPWPPSSIGAERRQSGVVRVRWTSPTGGPEADQYRVYAGDPVDYGTPIATVVAGPGAVDYHADLASLTPGVPTLIAVRSSNAAGEDSNTATVPITPDATPPDPPDDLSASPTFDPA